MRGWQRVDWHVAFWLDVIAADVCVVLVLQLPSDDWAPWYIQLVLFWLLFPWMLGIVGVVRARLAARQGLPKDLE